jgi:hypothetical protein
MGPVPDAALVDSRHVLQQVLADAEPVQRGLEAPHDVGGSQPHRGVDVADARDRDVLVEHGVNRI